MQALSEQQLGFPAKGAAIFEKKKEKKSPYNRTKI
jgi:hypothetical protein